MARDRKKRVTFMVDGSVLDQLLEIRARTGLSTSEQIRQGIRWWLESREWPVKEGDQTRARAAPVMARRRGMR